MSLLLDLALVAWLLALALYVTSARGDRDAIVAFIAFGLLLGLGWTRIAALDVALTEAAIGGGVTGMLLLRAEAHLRKRKPGGPSKGVVGKAVTAVACVMVTVGLMLVVLAFPSPAPTLAPAAAAALPATGLGNPVTAVLLAYRALDTLLEKVVLILALIGVWSLAPDGLWGGAPRLRPALVPEPLAYLAQMLPPFGVLIAVYMCWVGADAPGGTFQAGTVLAAMWLLVMLAGLSPEPETRGKALRLTLIAGPALFVAIGFLGFAMAGGFLSYPESIAKPLIVGIEAALTLSIAATLGLLVAGPAQMASGR
ncbi:MnhB domain-containing protein [Bosea sp. BK604]|uniref:MnhB domain-containing protein n=1 Tax=Bosea sp. BK604 TaxID=2512180 RepID=UPI00104DEE63|nr:MnhB domain-containing protein [Bosea sp. BK604]TCR66314.1 multisubunit sodium/proton antiporter MrpB subunit [Bosea sp. BK604]